MTTTISPLPTPPTPADSPVDFNTKAFALLGGLPTFVAEANAQAAGLDASVAAAGAQAAIATNKAGEALTSANNAALSKTGADSARDAAVIAKNSAEAALDSFDDRYLGQKPADPANDNDGGPLLVGALYFRTTSPIGMKVWTGAAWDDAYANLSSKFDKTGGDVDGNINFTGTARRITGDFSNATVANRVMFQTSTLNANTVVQALPNGSGPGGFFGALNSSDTSNFSRLLMGINQTSASIESQAQGTGGVLPLTFWTNNAERMRIDTSGNVLVTSPAVLGYGTGSGGTVTQATSKSTAVTLNKPSGRITMNAATLGAGIAVFFQLNNSLISGTDTVQVATFGGGASYLADCVSVSAGAALIRVVNNTGGSLSDALILNFSIIKGATS